MSPSGSETFNHPPCRRRGSAACLFLPIMHIMKYVDETCSHSRFEHTLSGKLGCFNLTSPPRYNSHRQQFNHIITNHNSAVFYLAFQSKSYQLCFKALFPLKVSFKFIKFIVLKLPNILVCQTLLSVFRPFQCWSYDNHKI